MTSDKRKNVTAGGGGSKSLASTSTATTTTTPINTTTTPTKSASNNAPETVSEATLTKKAKKKVRQNKRKSGFRAANGVEHTPTTAQPKELKKKKKSKKPREDGREEHEGTGRELVQQRTEDVSENWKLSPSLGGRFLMLDPVFARDEKYILLAHAKSLKIYSTKTSLLVRNIQIPLTKPTERIIAYLLDPVNDSRVYIATSSSQLFLWNWVDGKLFQKWGLGFSSIGLITVCADEKPDAEAVGVVYATDASGNNGFLYRLELPKNSKTEIKKSIIYKTSNGAISAAQVLLGGTIITIASERTLIIGNKHTAEGVVDENAEWGVFRKFPMTFVVSCMDSYIPADEGNKGKSKKNKKPKTPTAGVLGDVVVGDESGSMHLFHNVLRLREENKSEQDQVVRTLHWHRKKVRSVKWASNGNYIISGGSETVLVMWQVETGHKQFLPHLGSIIECLVVSPKANSYAILLSDNSIMVISTAELKAKTNIAGIQSRVFLPTEARQCRVPCVFHPTTANRLLLATPASQIEGSTSSPYLQTFDTYSDRHVARQALTRTNATNFNTGPEQDFILEPNVTLMAITSDGTWLATIDEWKPPRRKSDDGSSESPIVEDEGHGREIYLRFWKWTEQKKVWELVTRVDSPHPSASGLGAEEVYDLIAAPKGHEFATVGADGSVRIWKAKVRTRAGGIEVRTAEGALTSWGCRRAIMFSKGQRELELSTSTLLDVQAPTKPSKKGAAAAPPYWSQLAFSEDGSVIAIATPVTGLSSSNKDTTLYLADARAGAVRHTISGLQLGLVTGLGIHERHLIVLGTSKLLVYNLVNSSIHYEFPLETLNASSSAGGHLAIDHHSGTFAIAVAPRKIGDKHRVLVFKTDSVAPVHVQDVGLAAVTALKSSEGGKGYMALDAEARIQYISPVLAPHVSVAQQASSAEFSLEDNDVEVATGLSGVYMTNGNGAPPSGSDEEMEAVDIDGDEEEEEEEEEDGVVDRVVPREALENVFDAVPAYAAGSVEEAFEKVLALFVKKPLGADGDNEEDEDEDEDEEQDVNVDVDVDVQMIAA
ncbi:WD40-repeat-containing domain protein [Morchella snyderi]|nr:WD40-repeat-containing domain protein [Morchella snyderi]